MTDSDEYVTDYGSTLLNISMTVFTLVGVPLLTYTLKRVIKRSNLSYYGEKVSKLQKVLHSLSNLLIKALWISQSLHTDIDYISDDDRTHIEEFIESLDPEIMTTAMIDTKISLTKAMINNDIERARHEFNKIVQNLNIALKDKTDYLDRKRSKHKFISILL